MNVYVCLLFGVCLLLVNVGPGSIQPNTDENQVKQSSNKRKKSIFSEVSLLLIKSMTVPIILCIMLFFLVWSLLMLTMFHCYLIAIGKTTYEEMTGILTVFLACVRACVCVCVWVCVYVYVTWHLSIFSTYMMSADLCMQFHAVWTNQDQRCEKSKRNGESGGDQKQNEKAIISLSNTIAHPWTLRKKTKTTTTTTTTKNQQKNKQKNKQL